MDDAASGAHQGTTLQMEHSKDPKTDEGEMSGEFYWTYILIFDSIV